MRLASNEELLTRLAEEERQRDDFSEGLLAAKEMIRRYEKQLTEAEKDSARYEMLYELAVVGKDGKITIQLPLPTAADWDGVTCLWDRHVFRVAIDAAIGLQPSAPSESKRSFAVRAYQEIGQLIADKRPVSEILDYLMREAQ